MPAKLSLDEIREFWTEQAEKYQQSPAASWSDVRVIDLEIREILKHSSDGDRILDVGCANGYSTIQLAAHMNVNIRGLDFVPEMIHQANLRLRDFPQKLRGTVNFGVGDITALAEPPNTYDKVIVIRVLINLKDWSRQHRAIDECIRVLKPGGILLLSEATLQGWQKLNTMRREWGLTEIPMPAFNEYLDEEKLTESLGQKLHLVEVANFASTYYVATRVIKPLLIQALGAAIDVSDPNMEWNRWAAQLPNAGDYGTQKLFVFQKLA